MDSPRTPADAARRDFRASLCLVGFVTVAVLCGLAHDENWRKFLRISIASAVYVSALSALWGVVPRRGRAGLPFRAYAVAAAAAELSSGWLRPGVPAGTTVWVAAVAAVLLGGFHWLALARWRPFRESLLSGRTRAGQRVAGR